MLGSTFYADLTGHINYVKNYNLIGRFYGRNYLGCSHRWLKNRSKNLSGKCFAVNVEVLFFSKSTVKQGQTVPPEELCRK